MDKKRGASIGGGLCVGWSIGMLLGTILFRDPFPGSLIGIAAGGAVGSLLPRDQEKE